MLYLPNLDKRERERKEEEEGEEVSFGILMFPSVTQDHIRTRKKRKNNDDDDDNDDNIPRRRELQQAVKMLIAKR